MVLLSAQSKVGYYLPYAGFFASIFHEFLLCLPLLQYAICDNYHQTKVLVWKKCTCKSTFYIFKFLESLIPLVSTATPITGCSTLHEFGFITLLIKFPWSYTNIELFNWKKKKKVSCIQGQLKIRVSKTRQHAWGNLVLLGNILTKMYAIL